MTDAQKILPEWKSELDRIGFWRRFMLLSHWHGVNWWLMTISGLAVLFFIFIGLFPGLIAPFNYTEEAGPGKQAPGTKPDAFVLVARTDSGYTDFASLNNGVDRPSAAARVAVMDEVASRAVGQEGEALGNIRPRPMREFETPIDQVLTAVVEGEFQAALVKESDAGIVEKYPELTTLGYVGRHYERGFLMGTNVLGQDVFSRLIYGTRTTLIIGMLSAVFAAIVGIPIGLLSGFWGGLPDRLMTLLMDSLYSFPGLILAIAIAAVLSAAFSATSDCPAIVAPNQRKWILCG